MTVTASSLRHLFPTTGLKTGAFAGSYRGFSDQFMIAYQAALDGTSPRQKFLIGRDRTVPGTLNAIIGAYLDCSPNSTSPFKALARETQRTRRTDSLKIFAKCTATNGCFAQIAMASAFWC